MSVDRKNKNPSMRSWMKTLEDAGQLSRVQAEVDWDQEIGAIARVNISQKGPGLLFENIKDYQQTRSTRLMTCGLSNNQQVALMLGLPSDTSSKEMIKHLKEKYKTPVAPQLAETGPVKENILTGDDINLYDFPAPKWHHMDGGQYIDTFAAVVTKDPESDRPNVGIYRGMILGKNKIGKLLLKTQGWGDHGFCGLVVPYVGH